MHRDGSYDTNMHVQRREASMGGSTSGFCASCEEMTVARKQESVFDRLFWSHQRATTRGRPRHDERKRWKSLPQQRQRRRSVQRGRASSTSSLFGREVGRWGPRHAHRAHGDSRLLMIRNSSGDQGDRGGLLTFFLLLISHIAQRGLERRHLGALKGCTRAGRKRGFRHRAGSEP
jgi:hypothetical protein